MATAEVTYLRSELQQRRERLHSALHARGADASLSNLLTQVDAALSRFDAGTFGICESCHEPIEADRLLADPLTQFCLDHLPTEERRALESDLTLAARIQRGLLPPRDFSPAGWDVHYHYAPAGLVSGDYCDLLETPAGLLFLLGDVSGKGVAASMLMSHLHATFRSLADASASLDRMLELANHLFCESTLAGQYATLVAGRAARDGQVEFISAGHLPLLHLSKGGTTRRDSTGVPLGMFCDARFPVHRFALEPNDSVLLFTDGFTEARNLAGDEYGLERARGLAARHANAAPEQLIHECLADLTGFTGGVKQKDDLTLLALRRTA
jgi:sigma-B regulation protein RsbU (phosphoserine phosphatase)